MKAAIKVAVFALALLPSAALAAPHPSGARQHAAVLHSRSPRIRTKTMTVRATR